MRKHPSAIAAVSLAIGIGLNTALFALLDATLLRRLPVDRPEQLVDVYTSDTDGFAWHGSSYPDYLHLRGRARALTGLVGYAPAMAAVGHGGDSRVMPGELVTSPDGLLLSMIPIAATAGRLSTTTSSDARPQPLDARMFHRSDCQASVSTAWAPWLANRSAVHCRGPSCTQTIGRCRIEMPRSGFAS